MNAQTKAGAEPQQSRCTEILQGQLGDLLVHINQVCKRLQGVADFHFGSAPKAVQTKEDRSAVGQVDRLRNFVMDIQAALDAVEGEVERLERL